MTDYSKFTVVQLKEQIKSRNVPLTGLTRKAQLVDKLRELDAQTETAPVAEQPTATNDAQNSEEHIIEKEAKVIAGEEKPPEEGAAASDAAEDTDQGNVTAPTTQKDPIIATATDQIESEETANHENAHLAIDATTENSGAAAEMKPDATSEVIVKTKLDDARLPPPDVIAPSDPANDTLLQDTNQPTDASVSSSKLSSPAPEEGRKRKERSETPPIDAEEVIRKKQKQEKDDTLPDVHLKEDLKMGAAPLAADEPMQDATPNPSISKSEGNETEQTLKAMEVDIQTHTAAADVQEADDKVAHEEASKSQATKDQRYKGLFSANTHENQQHHETGVEADAADDEDRVISAAIHPATSALYIRDIMRPLHPGQFKDHLLSLAQPPNKEADTALTSESSLVDFHLDSIRTHCFAVFDSVSTAARVRAALHNRVWPAERTRKPLWVDFVPEDKVRGWIDIESDSGPGGPRSAKRWEVVYGNAEDATVVATLHEAGAPSNAPRHLPVTVPDSAPPSARLPPTPDVRRESSSTMAVTNGTGPSQSADQSASFVALDQLFHSTACKPKLYYQPVKKELSEKRLDELDARTSRRNLIPPGGSGYPDSRRYTFEDDDYLVDNGPEFGLRREGGPGPRGRGGFRGGWRGR